jgi:heat shock transcription factor
LTSRSFSRDFAPPGLNSQSLQDHNAQLAQKAKEIEELEGLQAAQNENVEGLMDMIQSYVNCEDQSNGVNDPTGLSNIDDYLDWGMPSGDLPGDTSLSNFDISVDGQPMGETGDIVDDLFGFSKEARDPGMMGGTLGDSGMGQILGTNPSTVVPSPVPSVGGRSREELEEKVEEVAPKRRRVG